MSASEPGCLWPVQVELGEDCVWIALFNGAGIERYSADARLVATIAFPYDNVTKLAGGLFSFRSPAPGLPATALAAEFLSPHEGDS